MDQVQQIKDKLDIVSLVSEYTPLKKAGNNFKANCPFHNEKSPSFVVSQERQMWHCFGCAKGGDIYTFLMEYEKVEFFEALRILAKKAGIELESKGFDSGISSQKERIYVLNNLAKEYYHYVLTSHKAGEKALEYIKKRGISEKMIQTFMIGFSPNGGYGLSDYLTKKKRFAAQDVIDAGLAFGRGGRTVDFFRGRLMFPLVDQRDNVVGFSGRILDDSQDVSKYVNTRETVAYHKGDHVFGINVTKDAIRRSGQAILTEGEFDVISCFQHGISNVVGVKGTALTEGQVTLLGRFAPKITFCFDGDNAGQEAIRRSLPIVERKGLTQTVIAIPDGKDPDEALKKDAGAFKKSVAHDIGIYDYLLVQVAATYDLQTSEGKKQAGALLLPAIAAIKNEIVKEHYIKKISQELDTSETSLTKEIQRLGVPEAPKVKEKVAKPRQSKEEMLEEYLLSLILQSEKPKEFLSKAMDILSGYFFAERACQKVLSQLMLYFEQHEVFDHKKFAALLPTELTGIYDTCLLFPLPEFIDGQTIRGEIEKKAEELKEVYVKKRMDQKAKEMDQLEQVEHRTDEQEEALSTLKTEYSKLASHLVKN